MTILFLDQFSELGGAQHCLLDLLPAVDQAGWRAHVALPGSGPFAQRLRERKIEVHPVSLHNYSLGRKTLLDGLRVLGDLAAMAPQLRGLVERLDPAVVYVNGPRLMPAVAYTRLERPVIFHLHNHVSAYNGLPLVRASVRRVNATVIAASEFLAKPWQAARVVYSGVEGPSAPRRAGRGKGPRVGMIGRITPQKKQREFVVAAAEIAGEFPDAEFFLWGDTAFGDTAGEQYRREILSRSPASLRYLGWKDDVYEALGEIDLLVVPSSGEGMPRVILEAFAARVPVLAAASGGIPEVVVEEESGFLLPSVPTAPELAERLRELLRAPERLVAAAEGAHRLWRERFTADRYRAEVWALVEAAASANSERNNQAAINPSAEADTSATP